MATTRQNLRDGLRLELKIDPNGRIWGDGVLNSNLEKARTKLQADGNYDWSFCDGEENFDTTAYQSAGYDLPENFVRLEEGTVRYNNLTVYPTLAADLRKMYPNLDKYATPSYYYLRNATINFYPKPDAEKAVNYYYRKRLDYFTADSSSTGMPDEFNEAVIQYAAYLTWADIQGREDKATQAYQNYKEALEGLYTQFLNRNDANLTFKFESV